MMRSTRPLLRSLAALCGSPSIEAAAAATLAGSSSSSSSSSSLSTLWDRQLALTSCSAAAECSCSSRPQAARHLSTASGGSGTSPRAPPAPLADPWTPSSQLIKRKTYQKRSRHLIQMIEQEQVAALSAGKQLPPFRSGDVLEVTTVVPEADRRAYTYRGVCIARANKGPRSWFKIYNVFPDVGGFVQHFPLYMPDLLSVKVVGRLARARRSKLYHLLADEGPKHIYQAAIPPPK